MWHRLTLDLFLVLILLTSKSDVFAWKAKHVTEDVAIRDSFDSDAQIIGILGLHNPIRDEKYTCGDINLKSGVMYLEAFRYAVNLVRNRSNYLYGAKLGYTVFDSCRSTSRLRSLLSKVILVDKVVGVVGPSTSDEAVFSAPVLSVFSLGMVSYRASSAILDNRGRYDTFYRTVPSDKYLVQSLVDILRYFNWTYVASICSHGYFGLAGIRMLQKKIENENICLSSMVTLPEYPTEDDYRKALYEATLDTKARVVILYTGEIDSIELLRAAKKMNQKHTPTVWLATTEVSYYPFHLNGIFNIPGTLLSLSVPRIKISGFKRHFLSLNPFNNPQPYFKEFWSKIFNCTFNGSNITRQCTGNEDMASKIKVFEEAPIYSIMRAVFMFSSALRSNIERLCIAKNKTLDNCVQKWTFLYKMLKTTSIHDLALESTINLDQYGGVPGVYDILHYREKISGRSSYIKVGSWDMGRKIKLIINESGIQWENNSNNTPRSVCSKPCLQKEGKIRIFKDSISAANSKCCWTCKSCHSNAIVINDSCRLCSMSYKPDSVRQRCIKLPVASITYKNVFSIFILTMSAIGILLTSVVLYLFLKNRHSKIVKASGRELCYIILSGIYLCFLSSLLFLAPPSTGICGVQRFIAGFSLSFCYSPLLLKTNRIYRIFKHAKRSINRPPFVSPLSQVLITNGISSLQILLGVIWIAGDIPEVMQHYPKSRDKVIKVCKSNNYTMALNLAVCLVLMIACTYLAFKTRHFPKFYNEAQSIGITMYISCFVWGVFLPIFLFTDDAPSFARTLSVAVFCNVIAYVTLFGLFLVKVLFILFPRDISPNERGTVSSSQDSKKTYLSPITLHRIKGKHSSFPLLIQLTGEFKKSVGTSTYDLDLKLD